MIEHVIPEEKEIHSQKKLLTCVDLSFRCHGKDFIEGDVRGPMSILQEFPNKESVPLLRFDQDLMRGTDEVSQRLIPKIVDLYHQYRISHCLQPGEILFIDNQRAVHGRSAFFPKYDGNDRFLIRCFATLDYAKSEYARTGEGRTVAAIYS
jgi:L-asparagine oxygenase